MVTLVKTCKTFELSQRIDWSHMRKTVEGVHVDRDGSFRMVFEEDSAEVFMLAKNHSETIHISTIGPSEERDVHFLNLVLKECSDSSNTVSKKKHNYSVFRVELPHVDIYALESRLLEMGVDAVLEPSVNVSLVFTHMGVDWEISDPRNSFATVRGLQIGASRNKVELSIDSLELYTD